MSRNKAGDWRPATGKKPLKARAPAAVPLTDEERTEAAREAEEKADIHLAEAIAMAAWGRAPNACIHSAYYAMHFIAVAALLRAGGVGKRRNAPESHEHVLQHYLRLAETLPPPLNESGRELNRARDMRVEADYFRGAGGDPTFGVHGATLADATTVTDKAADIISQLRQYWKTKT